MEEHVNLFIHGTSDEYNSFMAKYINDPETLAAASSVKQCSDGKLTDKDKENASSALVSLPVSDCVPVTA